MDLLIGPLVGRDFEAGPVPHVETRFGKLAEFRRQKIGVRRTEFFAELWHTTFISKDSSTAALNPGPGLNFVERCPKSADQYVTRC
jgi:hypothetical protein